MEDAAGADRDAGPAPFDALRANGPEGGRAVWSRTADGVRLRIAVWPEGRRGTVLILPGRTEYVEKYGRLARDLAAMGFAAAAVDFRGQGLSDRLHPDPSLGHVGGFADYQHDVAALTRAARDLPGSRFLIAHSMGGAIGLRAVIQGLDVAAALFSAPMWGIGMARLLRPVAWALTMLGAQSARLTGPVPGMGHGSYAATAPFEGNLLTGDAEMFAWMQAQIAARPRLALGAPTLHWVAEALRETRALGRVTLPDLPVAVALGGREAIVDARAIRRTAERWRTADLWPYPEARHEVLMEDPATRADIAARLDRLFSAA